MSIHAAEPFKYAFLDADRERVNKTETSFIPTAIARNVVKPYKLREILLCLREAGLIQAFKIGRFLVRIESENRRRFELSSVIEEAGMQCNSQRPKRSMPM